MRTKVWRSGAVVVALAVAATLSTATSAAAVAERDVRHSVEADKKPKVKKARKKAAAKGLPADACTLLTAAEVETIVPPGRAAE